MIRSTYRLVCCLLLLWALPVALYAQPPQTLFYKNGQKFMEGRWTYRLNPDYNMPQYLMEDQLFRSWPDMAAVQEPLEFITKAFVYEGPLTIWYANGRKAYDCTFSNGLLNGKTTHSDSTGTLRYSGQFENGMPDGDWRVYFPNGHIAWSGTFEAYTQAELAATFRARSVPYAGESPMIGREFYNHREAVEVLKEDFIEPAWRVYQFFLMNNSKRNGTYTFYGLNGKKEAEISYRNGAKDGVCALYLDDGRLLSSVRYRSDTLVDDVDAIRWSVMAKWTEAYNAVPQRSGPQLPGKAYGNPQFPGGDSALNRFLRRTYDSNATLWNSASPDRYIGAQTVCFIIAEDGSVHNVRPVGTSLNADDFAFAAAIRKMPNWVWPKGYDGKSLSMHFVTVHRGARYPY